MLTLALNGRSRPLRAQCGGYPGGIETRVGEIAARSSKATRRFDCGAAAGKLRQNIDAIRAIRSRSDRADSKAASSAGSLGDSGREYATSR